MTTHRKAYFGALFTSGQPLVLSALMLPASLYVVRGLGETAYGQWATATALITFLTFVTNLGLRTTFVRTVARQPDQAGATLADQLGARLSLSFAAAAIALVICVAMGYSRTILLCTAVSAVGLILTTLATTASDFLQGLQRLGVVASVNMAAGITLTAASVLVVLLDQGPVAVALSYLVGPLVSIVLLFRVIRQRHVPVRAAFSVVRLRHLLFEARFIASAQLVHSASLNAEGLMLPRIAGETVYGQFSGGTIFVTRLAAIPDGMAAALYPAVVEAERTSPRGVVKLVSRFSVLGVVASVAIAIGVSIVAGPVSRLLFPASAESTRVVMQITIWLLPVMTFLWILGAALNGLNGDAAQARAAVIAACVNLGMTAWLVSRFGLMGAAWSMVLRYLIWLAVFMPCAMPTFRPVLDAARPKPPQSPAVRDVPDSSPRG